MRVIVVLIVLGCLAAAGPGSARAADEGMMASGASASAAVGGCKTVTAWRGFKLLIGPFAWKYFGRIRWCYNGKKITSFGYRRWAEVYVPTWDFVGHIGKSGYGGVGTVYATRWTQGKFRQCAAYCFQTKTPWVDITVTRKGEWSTDTGG